jgi:hypothetical protein
VFFSLVNSLSDFLTYLLISGILDKINSCVEYAILYPFYRDIKHLTKVKTSISLNISSQFMWGLYCAYGIAYFSALGQWYSVSSSMVWTLCYVFKIYFVFKYKPKPLTGDLD